MLWLSWILLCFEIKDSCWLVIDCVMNFEDIENQFIEPIVANTTWLCDDMWAECDSIEQLVNKLLIITKSLSVSSNSYKSY